MIRTSLVRLEGGVPTTRHQGAAKITGNSTFYPLLKLYPTNYRSSVLMVLPLLLINQAYLSGISSYIKHGNTKN